MQIMISRIFPRSTEYLKMLDEFMSEIECEAESEAKESFDSLRSLIERIRNAEEGDETRSEDVLRRLDELTVFGDNRQREEQNNCCEKENAYIKESPITETPIAQRTSSGKIQLKLGTTKNASSKIVKAVTVDEFSKIPGYQKGRMALEDLNAALTVLEKLWTENRALLNSSTRSLKSAKLDARILLCTQAKEIEGCCYFCSESDLRNALDAKRRPLVGKYIQCLRHVSRIKYTRLKNSVVLLSCYEK